MSNVQVGGIHSPSHHTPRNLRRVKNNAVDLSAKYSKCRKTVKPEDADVGFAKSNSHGKLLRIWLTSPWEHYTSARTLSPAGGSCLAYRNGAYFSKAAIRVFPYPKDVQALQRLSDIRHPNVASIYDLYCHEEVLYAATEYLELSLADLDFQTYDLEEWEIATILLEVR